jgi:cytochrome P450 family 117 subfamily A
MVANPFSQQVHYRKGLPVLPGAFPVVGHVPALYVDGFEIFRRGHETIGPLFWLYYGFGLWSITCTGRECIDVLRNKAASTIHIKRAASMMMGESLMAQDGATHLRMRFALNEPFTPRGITKTGIGTHMADVVNSRVARWAERRSVTVLSETQELALSVIFRIIGVEVDDLTEWRAQYQTFVLSAAPYVPDWIPGSPTWRAARARSWLDKNLLEIVRRERARANTGTFIAELAHGRDEQGRELSDRELIDNLILLTLAGHETTASVLAWFTIWLARRPDFWTALCDEAGKQGDLPKTLQEAREFPFAEALMREVLRLYSPVCFTVRETLAPITLCGHVIPEKTHVTIPLSYIARDPELYPNPDRLDPSRWLSRKEPPTMIEMSQFGGGPHFCIGYHLAWLEMIQFAVALARQMTKSRYRPKLADGLAPRHHAIPLGHPSRNARVEFV